MQYVPHTQTLEMSLLDRSIDPVGQTGNFVYHASPQQAANEGRHNKRIAVVAQCRSAMRPNSSGDEQRRAGGNFISVESCLRIALSFHSNVAVP
eukprot:SAG11_NODE_29415_length_311_cov_0.650943_1_plen_93_part_01